MAAWRAFLPWLAALSAAGCFLVAPLGEFDPVGPNAAGSGGRGGGNGGLAGSQMASSGEGGAAGTLDPTGGAPPAAGMAGEAGEAGGAPPGPSGCTSNEECIEDGAGAPYRCTETGKCVALRNGVCPLVYDDEGFKAADPIYVGAFAPLPPALPDTSDVLYPLRMALREISGDAYGGLLMPNGKRRPIVLVVCDNGEDSVDPAAEHLFDDIGVSAVLATLLPGDLRRVFERYKDRNVFFLSPVGATSAVAALDDQDLVWTMLGQPKDLVPVYRDLIENLVEPYLRDIRGIGDRPLRVVLLRGADAFGIELSSLVAEELTWNGKSVVENDADGNYQGYTFPGTLSPAEVVKEILDADEPVDLVISTAGQEVTRPESGFVELLETQWDGYVNAPRPFYVLSPFNAGDIGSVLRLVQIELTGGTDPGATKRFVGVTAASADDGSLQQTFAVALGDAFPASKATLNDDTGNYYDAFYFLAYAMYGARVNRPQGTDIARGMRRLLAGERFNVGVKDISPVFKALAVDGASIELDGTLGRPAFDPETGVHVDPGAVYCMGATGSTAYVSKNALRYAPATGTFEGNFTCFDDFVP